jgi:serine phosphatase RsbU (regulator of sigma subunit)
MQFLHFREKFQSILRIRAFSCLFVFSAALFAQDQKKIDSLQKLLPSLGKDSNRIIVLNSLSAQIVDMDPAKAIAYAKEAVKLAQSLGYKKSEATGLQNIGNGSYNLAEFKVALSFYIEALHIQESIKNKKGILSASGSIGNVFLDLKQPDEAYKYFQQSLKIARELKSKNGTASSLIAIGTVFSDKADYKKALDYAFQAVKIFEEIGNHDAAATCYNNIADNYQNLNEMKKALFYVKKAYGIYLDEGNVYGMALALNNMGSFNDISGKHEKALEFYRRGLEQAKKINANDRILASYKGMYTAYKKMKNFEAALAVNELFQNLNSEIYNSENSKQIAEMQTRFDSESKAKEIDLLTKDKKIKEDELIKQRLISWSVAGGGVLILLMGLLAVRGYIQKRKVNAQLAVKNEKIETAYNIIEDQHKDIKDSIKYAKRLQEAILPTEAFKNFFMENAFVLFRPKDIVSGDFYWVDEVKTKDGDQLLFAAVDCTGHGVPGAFMSIVGHNLLNQTVNEHHKTKPSEILDGLNIGLSKTLHQTFEESSVKDGMDIALCSLQKNNTGSYTLQFAGANNPVWIVRAKTAELIEIKGDKFPVGIFVGEELNKFNNKEIELFEGDSVYVFTDGYADQFGGERGKKFKYKPLQQLILSIQHLNMKEQSDILDKTLINWKGNLEQVDDVLLIGIRVS